MANALVIVESPAKAKTIAKYLGSNFVVESSIGHIRDLPSTAAEIPPEIKGEDWARLGVNVRQGFEPYYVVPKEKKAQVAKLKQKLKGVDELYLATDEDREGEAIAWHLKEVLNPKVPVKRMVFDEITKKAITAAVHNTRQIDDKLVSAQETRRILDRLYGYEVSPVLWRKVKPRLSAGRVQSVATRLIVARERARMAFRTGSYWDLSARLRSAGEDAASIDTRLIEAAGQRVASGKDFDETTGQLKPDAKVRLLDAAAAQGLAQRLGKATFKVTEIKEQPYVSKPYAPFITSTLQQEAGRKLRFTAQRTMRIAQSLYENGYITYMRTDSTNLSTQAIDAARSQIAELYGNDFMPAEPRVYAGKSKNAQEAHEAIRPAGEAFRTPRSLEGELDPDQLKLYDLIWKRTVASQMKNSEGLRTTVRMEAPDAQLGPAVFSASGKVIQFAGYLRAYVEGSDDPEAEMEDMEKVLPPLREGQQLSAESVQAEGHETQPPARYTEASLIKELEDRGIGRPSTYAAILQTIQDRGYVWKKGSALVPTFTAFAVTQLLEQHLGVLVDYDFTARLEDALDAIANGERDAVPWLTEFYFGPKGRHNGDAIADSGLKNLVGNTGEEIDPRAICSIPLGRDAQGHVIVARVGRYGAYLQHNGSEERAGIPDDIAPDELTIAKAEELLAQAAQGDRVIGHDPDSGKPIYIKSGRFGPYVQLGDPEVDAKGKIKRDGKPKMASLWPGMKMETLTLEEALKVLSFPREVGVHPDSGEVITAQDGKFGPYIRMGDDSRSLTGHEQLSSITLAEAVELFKQPKGRRRAAAGSAAIAELGVHPQSGGKIQVKNGRFGPYVTDGVVNATIPKGRDPAHVTLDQALDLIAAREQKMRDQGKDPRAEKPKKAPRSARSSAKDGAPTRAKPRKQRAARNPATAGA